MADQIDPDSIHLGGISPEYYANYSPPPPIEPGSPCELPPADSLTIPSISLLPIAQSCVPSFPDPVPEIFVPAVPPPSGCEVLMVEAPDITTCPITEGSFLVLTSAGPTESDQGVQECKLKLSGLICAEVPCPDGTKVEMDVTFGGAASEKSYFNIEESECSSKSTLHIEIPPPCESNASTFDIKLSGAISGSFSDPATTECGAPPDCGCNYKGFLHVDPACTTFTGSADKIKFIGDNLKNSSLEVVSKGVPECGFELVGNIQVDACSEVQMRVVTIEDSSLLKSSFTGQSLGSLDLSLQSEVIPIDACNSILKLKLGGGGSGGGGGGGGGGLAACGTTAITTQIKGTNAIRKHNSDGSVSVQPLISGISIENDCSARLIIVEMLLSGFSVKSAHAGYIVRVLADASVSITKNPLVDEIARLEALGETVSPEQREEASKVAVFKGDDKELVPPSGYVLITKLPEGFSLPGDYDLRAISTNSVVFLKKLATGMWEDEGTATGDNQLAVLDVTKNVQFTSKTQSSSQSIYTGLAISTDKDVEDSDQDGNVNEILPDNLHEGVRILKKTTTEYSSNLPGYIPPSEEAPVYSYVSLAVPPALVIITEIGASVDIIPLVNSCSPCQQVLTITMNPIDIPDVGGGGGGFGGGSSTTNITNNNIRFFCSESGYSAKAYEDAIGKIAGTVGEGDGNDTSQQAKKIMEDYEIFKDAPASQSLTGGTGAALSKIDKVVFDRATAFDKADISKGLNKSLSRGFTPLSADPSQATRKIVDTKAVLAMKNDLANKQGIFSDPDFVDAIQKSGALNLIGDNLQNADNESSKVEVITNMNLNWLNTNLVAAPTCAECCTGSSSFLELCGKTGGMLYLDNLAFSEGDSFSSNTITTTGIDINKDTNRLLIDVSVDGNPYILISSKDEEGADTNTVVAPESININDTIHLTGKKDEEEFIMGGLSSQVKFSCKSGDAPITIRNPELFPGGPAEFAFKIKEIVICDEQGKSKKAYVLMAIPA